MAQITNLNSYVGKCIAFYRSAEGYEPVDLQISDLASFLSMRGMSETEFINISELNISSAKDITNFLKLKSVTTVVLWRLDCFPASLANLSEYIGIFGDLSRSGIAFLSVKDHLDSFEASFDFLRKLDIAWWSLRKSRKVENARYSSIKASNRGNKTGRKRIRNDQLIRKLRSQGLSIRKIADKIKLSTTAVQRALKPKSETGELVKDIQT